MMNTASSGESDSSERPEARSPINQKAQTRTTRLLAARLNMHNLIILRNLDRRIKRFIAGLGVGRTGLPFMA
jgi:hypothetical protein